MEKPVLSDKFTIEDIHKIREYHDAITANMTVEEKIEFYNNGAMEVLNLMKKNHKDRILEKQPS